MSGRYEPLSEEEEQRRRLVSIMMVTLTDVVGFGVKVRGLAVKAEVLHRAFTALGLQENLGGNVYRWTHPEVAGLVVDGRLFKLAAETTTPDELRDVIEELFDAYAELTGRAAPRLPGSAPAIADGGEPVQAPDGCGEGRAPCDSVEGP